MSAERRAARLLRWYPQEWRRRYGDEFWALLVDEFSERPRSARRALDVAFSGLLARVRAAGLAGPGLDAERQLRAGLAVLGCALAVFVVGGVALWSQLTIGWQWSAPNSGGTHAGMLLMSAAVVAIVTLVVLAAMPIAWTVARVVLARRARPLAGAFASAADFARDDVIAHAGALSGTPVRIASGSSDPFHPGVEALARVLPASSSVTFTAGCHDGPFFTSQQYASLAFLGSHLATSG
jgi:hypothetical protein